MQTTAIGTVANSLPGNEVILLTLLISKGYILFAELINNSLQDQYNPVSFYQKLRIKKRLHIASNEIILLFVGRLHTIKGLKLLINAFKIALKQESKLRLFIVGNGTYDEWLSIAKPVWSKISFTGYLTSKELLQLYSIADIGLIPSIHEEFGLVALEMMMHELPIVATATSGLNEVVDESCGLKVPLIVSPDSVEIDTSLLAQKIVYLLQNPKEAKRLGKNGRKRYLEKYSSEVFGKNMIAFYKSLFQECK